MKLVARDFHQLTKPHLLWPLTLESFLDQLWNIKFHHFASKPLDVKGWERGEQGTDTENKQGGRVHCGHG